jgi:2,3,4,5-tetrahydropyridine-2-carboxylate N-succinyltransferase
MDILRAEIEHLYARGALPAEVAVHARHAFREFHEALTRGEVRAAEKRDGQWRVNSWVKQGILLGFRLGELEETHSGPLSFVDKDTFPARQFGISDRVRVVPGGSSIRTGAYIARKRVHLSAAAQIGCVLEPVGASPVIIEDDVLVGGNCGVYEGTQVRSRAVLGAGVILTRATPVYDIVREQVYRSSADAPLIIPENAVVVPGSRAITKGKAADWGLSLYTPVIVKYRDEKTQGSIELEDLLR